MAFDPRLGHGFMFDEETLRANRQGRLTAQQEQLFDRTVTVMQRGRSRSLALVTVAFAVAIIATVLAISATPGGGTAAAAVAGGILLALFLLVAVFMRRAARTTQAFADRRVREAQGALSITTDSTGTWWARVGDARFGVELDQAQALTEGARYRVAYLLIPDGAVPLSLERLEG